MEITRTSMSNVRIRLRKFYWSLCYKTIRLSCNLIFSVVYSGSGDISLDIIYLIALLQSLFLEQWGYNGAAHSTEWKFLYFSPSSRIDTAHLDHRILQNDVPFSITCTEKTMSQITQDIIPRS